jgi:hypothetical protein
MDRRERLALVVGMGEHSMVLYDNPGRTARVGAGDQGKREREQGK